MQSSDQDLEGTYDIVIQGHSTDERWADQILSSQFTLTAEESESSSPYTITEEQVLSGEDGVEEED